jgi:hypothetical protein
MSTIAANNDSPDDDKHADSEQQMNPPWALERERADCPDHDHRETNENTEIHSLLVN